MTIQSTPELLKRLDDKKKEWDANRGKKDKTVLLLVCKKCGHPSEWFTVQRREATQVEKDTKKVPPGTRLSMDGRFIETKIRNTATMIKSDKGMIHKMCV